MAYFVKDTGKVYHKPSTTWVELVPIVALVLDKDIQVDAVGHVFKINGAVVAVGNLVDGGAYTIAHRRWVLTENGLPSGTPYKDFQVTSLVLKRSGLVLEEFEDYTLLHDGQVRSVTININNRTLYTATEFNAEFKLDVSAEQFYRDALEVSKTSAFPEVSYDVSFVYLNQAFNTLAIPDTNQNKTLRLGAM